MDVTIEKPAVGVLASGVWKDAHSYTVACECGTKEHTVDAWVEVDTDTVNKDITVTFYVEPTVHAADSFWSRLKVAAGIMLRGRYTLEHGLVLREQAAKNLLGALQSSITTLKG